jgi:AcrR family transcriptional regulator
MNTKKGEKQKLRGTILDRAIRYFKTHGSGGSGVSSVMKEAGLTTGALYSHFESKEDLFGEAICRELEQLEENLFRIFRTERKNALKVMIELHFNEAAFHEVGDGCIFTALGTDMHRSKARYRARYEEYTKRIYRLFADAIQEQFPAESPASCYERAIFLYSALVGSMTMARTMKSTETAYAVLAAGRNILLRDFVAPVPAEKEAIS